MDKVLLIDKPAGMTSHDVVDRVRKIYGTRRVGHAGTLDPFATGLLIIGVGDATKRLSEYVGLDKTYEATARLGATSTTYDPEGKIVLRPTSYVPSREEIEKTLKKFRGGYEQKAPLYSAKKVGGKKLYELARRGKANEEDRPSKFVKISKLEITDYDPHPKIKDSGLRTTDYELDRLPILKFRITCSSGTYIRSLADDIGRELGCGAYLTELRRTKIGDFSLANSVSLDKLTAS